MKTSLLALRLSALGIAALILSGAARAAEVRVMISAGFHGVYAELGPAFERASGHRLITIRGPSMGDSPEAIPTRLARGEIADVVILDGGAADDLAARGLVRADSKIDLSRSLIGMVVRAGASKPDISTVDALRSTLLAAKSIGYSDSGSGTYLSTKLFAKLGIAVQIAAKTRKVRGPPSGEPVAAVVARGEVEIGFQQVAELIHVPGVTFVATIPAEVQPPTFFSGVVTATAQQPAAAQALIQFLSSPEAAPTMVKAGLVPINDAATLKELAPTGTLRVAIAVGPAPSGIYALKDLTTSAYRGVTIDLSEALGRRLGVPVAYVPYLGSGDIQNSAASGLWDVTYMPVDDERRKFVDFGSSYHLLQSTYLVAAGSVINSVANANNAGVRIAGVKDTATFRASNRASPKATHIALNGVDEAIEMMLSGKVDAIALGRASLGGLLPKIKAARVLDDNFLNSTTAVAVPKGKPAALAYVSAFIEDAKASGLVRRAFDNVGLKAEQVAPASR